MVYHHVQMNPSEGQMSDLANGEEVKLSHHHLEGDVSMHLTTAQVRKIMKAHAAGKGCTLKLSAAQVKHHAMHGSGVFSDFLRRGINFARPLARKGLHHGVSYLEDKVADALHLNPPKAGTGFLSDALSSIGLGVRPQVGMQTGKPMHCMPGMPMQNCTPQAMQGEGFLSDALSSIGLGVKPKRMKKGKQGKGIFGDALKWAGHAGVNGLVGLTGLGVKPRRAGTALAMPRQKKGKVGAGFVGDAARWLGHAGVNGLVGLTGLGVGPMHPNMMPMAQNDQLMQALGKKKLGAGLY